MKRNFGLDLVRTFSIYLVIIRHSGFNFGLPENIETGSIGVEIFFVLSGFLIGGILLKSFNKELSTSSLKKFWIRRWFRILPVYYLMLFVKFILIPNKVGWHILYYFFFLQNNFYGVHFYTVTWSLAIEEWFYLVAPIYLFFAFKISNGNKKTIANYILLFILAENIARVLYVYMTHSPVTAGNPAFRMDCLFVGIWIAFLKQNYQNIYKELQTKKYFFTGVFLFLGYIFYLYSVSIPPNSITTNFFQKTIGMFLFSACIALMIPFVEKFENISQKKYFQKIFFHAVTQTSLLTYSIYLIHPLVYEFVIWKNKFLLNSHYIKVFIAILITYIFASIVYRFYEKPMLNLREYFS